MFVGDSLGRNQWESLICMISAAVPRSPTQLIRGEPLSTFKFTVSVINRRLLWPIGLRVLIVDNNAGLRGDGVVLQSSVSRGHRCSTGEEGVTIGCGCR